MASASIKKKLRVLLIPFFATSHIGPFTDLAVRLAMARPGTVEVTVAVTPANVPVVRSVLERHGEVGRAPVKIATYPFPAVDGLPEGVENPGKAVQADAWRIDVAAMSEAVMRPAQEPLIREQSPDAVVTDVHFFWNIGIADELGVPCVMFHVIGAFSTLAMRHLFTVDVTNDAEVVSVPKFPAPSIWIPRTELPEFLRNQSKINKSTIDRHFSEQGHSFGIAINTFPGLEQQYHEMYVRNGYAKRTYLLGPLLLPLPPVRAAAAGDDSRCINWLDTKPSRSVVYLCFGSLAHVSDAQLHELALGLEASGKSFLWVVRAAEKWTPPEGWEERVGDRGMIATAWVPQTAILQHPAVGVFVTHCGWNSVLETVAAGVPVLTWPMVFEQFITERLVTEVLKIGERLWPADRAGVRSTRYKENEVIPAETVAQAVSTFMQPGGPGDSARGRAMDLAEMAHTAVAEGGSSSRDLHRLIDDLMEARGELA